MTAGSVFVKGSMLSFDALLVGEKARLIAVLF